MDRLCTIPRLLAYGYLGKLGCLLFYIIHAADHVECRLRNVVTRTRQNFFEIVDSGFQINKGSSCASEDFGNEEWLREETLHLACTGDGKLVLIAQFVHTQDRDDVLERFVVLQDLLCASSHIVMALSNDRRVKHSRSRVQRIYRRVDAKL